MEETKQTEYYFMREWNVDYTSKSGKEYTEQVRHDLEADADSGFVKSMALEELSTSKYLYLSETEMLLADAVESMRIRKGRIIKLVKGTYTKIPLTPTEEDLKGLGYDDEEIAQELYDI